MPSDSSFWTRTNKNSTCRRYVSSICTVFGSKKKWFGYIRDKKSIVDKSYLLFFLEEDRQWWIWILSDAPARPLTIPNPRDNRIFKSMTTATWTHFWTWGPLEDIFEGCHTAFKDMLENCQGTITLIHADVVKCFYTMEPAWQAVGSVNKIS